MANISTNLTINPDTATDATNDLIRLGASIGGIAYTLAQHVIGDNTNNNETSDNANGPLNNCGTNIQAGATVTLNNGAQVSGGSLYIRGASTGAAGALVLDEGSALSLGRLVLEGQAGSGGTEIIGPNEADLTRYPRLELRDGSVINMTGGNGNPWRMFLGNWSKGRVLCYDSSIIVNNVNRSTFEATDVGRANLFLGFHSEFSNSLLKGMNKVELLGAVPVFNNVNVEYTVSADWLTDGQLGGSGAFYLAGAAGIQATLGPHTVTLPSTVDIYPSTGNNSFKYAVIREQGCILTLNGQIDIVHGTTTFNPRSHHFMFQGTVRDISRRFELQGRLNASGARLAADGTPDGTFNGKFGLMDNRDFLQINHRPGDWTNGVAPEAIYDWYNLPNHGVTDEDGNNVVLYGFPTGTNPDRIYGIRSSNDDSGRSAIRGAARTFDSGSAGTTITQIGDIDVTSLNANLVRDLRRFYPFRAGGWEWTYTPEYVNSGLGGTAMLGVIGGGITGTVLSAGNARLADATADDIRNGKTQAITVMADPVLAGVTRATAASRPITLTVASDTLTARMDNGVTMDQVHERVAEWGYTHFDSEADIEYTATALTAANQHANGTTSFNATSIGANNVGFYTTVPVLGTATSAPTGTAWSAVVAARFGTNVNLLSEAHGDPHQWIRAFVYAYESGSSWALFGMTREYNQTGGGADQCNLIHLASQGNVGTNVRYQIADLRDSLSFVTDHPIRDYLWRQDVGLSPLGTNGTTCDARRVILDFNDTDVVAGTHLNTYNLDANSSIVNAHQLQVNVSGSGTVSGFQNEAAGIAIADGVRVSGGTLQFAGGQRYNVAGDMTGVTLERTGTGTAEIVYSGTGTGPVSAANFSFVKRVSVSFVAPTGDTWTAAQVDSDETVNISAVSRHADSDMGGTVRTPTSRTFTGNTLTYNYEIPFDEDLHYVWAGRRVGAAWYNPVQGQSTLTTTPSHNLTVTQTTVVPINEGEATNLPTHIAYIENMSNAIVNVLTAPTSTSNKMTITIDNTSVAGLLDAGKYVTRLIQQKTNYQLNVARGYYALNGFVIGTDRIIYNDVNVTWQKDAADTNIVAFGVQVLDATGNGANFAVTTDSTETYVVWNGPTNIGILSPDQEARLARRVDVWAANAAL